MAISNCSFSYSLYTMLISIYLVVATNASRVDDVCSQLKDPQLCVVALGGPNSEDHDLQELAMIGFQTAARGAALSHSKFVHLMVSSPRPDLNPMFSQCESLYDDACETITSAQQAASFGRWDQVIPNVIPVLGHVDQCEDLFIGTSPAHSSGDKVRVAAEAILVIAKTLIRSWNHVS